MGLIVVNDSISKFCVFAHRVGNSSNEHLTNCRCPFLGIFLRSIYHLLKYLNVIFWKIFLQEEAKIGENVCFSRKGNIILGADRIGDDCVIHHNTTIGMHLAGNENLKGTPSLGNRVWVGPNTIIHGKLKIGDGVTILGETVLTKNIPDCCVVGGNPAKILLRDFNNSKLLLSSSYDITRKTIQEWAVINV